MLAPSVQSWMMGYTPNSIQRLRRLWPSTYSWIQRNKGKYLSGESKMLERTDGLKCTTTNIHPKYCNTGSKLRLIKGTPCSGCYGHKGNYLFPTVQSAMDRKYETLMTDRYWVLHMALAIDDADLHRWQGNGDLQGIGHLIKIVAVAYLRPDVMFWLPTLEHETVNEYLAAGGPIPGNLVIRRSSTKVDQHLPMRVGHSSMVTTTGNVPYGTFICESLSRGGICGDCMACWDKKYLRIAYRKH